MAAVKQIFKLSRDVGVGQQREPWVVGHVVIRIAFNICSIMACWLLGWKLSMNAFREVGEVGYNCDFPAVFLILVFVEMKRIIVHN